MTDVTGELERLKAVYGVRLKLQYLYKQELGGMPGQLFLNDDGIYVGDFEGNRIVKFEKDLKKPDILPFEIIQPAGLLVFDNKLWVNSLMFKKLFIFNITENTSKPQGEIDFAGKIPIWIKADPSNGMILVAAINYQAQCGGSLWKLENGIAEKVLEHPTDSLTHLQVIENEVVLFDQYKKSVYFFDKKSWNVNRQIKFGEIKGNMLASGIITPQNDIFVIDNSNWLYKFNIDGNMVFQSDILRLVTFMENHYVMGGYHANIVYDDSALYVSDVKNGYIVAINCIVY